MPDSGCLESSNVERTAVVLEIDSLDGALALTFLAKPKSDALVARWPGQNHDLLLPLNQSQEKIVCRNGQGIGAITFRRADDEIIPDKTGGYCVGNGAGQFHPVQPSAWFQRENPCSAEAKGAFHLRARAVGKRCLQDHAITRISNDLQMDGPRRAAPSDHRLQDCELTGFPGGGWAVIARTGQRTGIKRHGAFLGSKDRDEGGRLDDGITSEGVFAPIVAGSDAALAGSFSRDVMFSGTAFHAVRSVKSASWSSRKDVSQRLTFGSAWTQALSLTANRAKTMARPPGLANAREMEKASFIIRCCFKVGRGSQVNCGSLAACPMKARSSQRELN